MPVKPKVGRLHYHRLEDSASSVAFTPDSRSLVTLGWSVSVHDTHTGGKLTTWDTQWKGQQEQDWLKKRPYARSLSPDGKHVLLVYRAFRVRQQKSIVLLAKVADGSEVMRMEVLACVDTAVVSPDGRRILTANNKSHPEGFTDKGTNIPTKSELRLWDIESRKEVARAEAAEGHWGAPIFSADGQHVFCTQPGNKDCLRVLNAGTLKELDQFGGKTEATYLAASPDGKYLVSSAGDPGGIVRVWDVGKKTEVRQCVGHGDVVFALAVSSAKRILSGGGRHAEKVADPTVRLWDLTTGHELAQWNSPRKATPNDLGFDLPISRIRIPPRPLHDGPVGSVAFSPNGRYAASLHYTATLDITVVLWGLPE